MVDILKIFVYNVHMKQLTNEEQKVWNILSTERVTIRSTKESVQELSASFEKLYFDR